MKVIWCSDAGEKKEFYKFLWEGDIACQKGEITV